MNVYKKFPLMENENFILRKTVKEDAAGLLKVYSDEKSVPLFNSDNCHGDDFHYTTIERMNQAIDFWEMSYSKGYFVRWTIVNKTENEIIGSAELFHRDAGDHFTNCGLLRLDLRSDFEKAQTIESIVSVLLKDSYEFFGCDKIAIKAVPSAEERRKALVKTGFNPTDEKLIGHDGTEYGDYFVRNNFSKIDLEKFYRKGVFNHFAKDCKCSLSITNSIDVTDLRNFSRNTGTKFYLNFLYILTKVLNSRPDYRMMWKWDTNELVAFDKINPTQYVFHEDTETFTIAYTDYYEDYRTFYDNALEDLNRAKESRDYGLDAANHPNWFDASSIPWISYDSLNIELPDGYLYLMPIVNWGKFREENGKTMMSVSVRFNHAAADGYLVSKVFLLIEEEIKKLGIAN